MRCQNFWGAKSGPLTHVSAVKNVFMRGKGSDDMLVLFFLSSFFSLDDRIMDQPFTDCFFCTYVCKENGDHDSQKLPNDGNYYS